MRGRLSVSIVIFLSLLCSSSGNALGQTHDQASMTSQHPGRKQQGFFDYALDKVNPNGTDYGAAMQVGRNGLVADTIDDLYFWSNIVTLLLLVGLTAVLFLQLRSEVKREIIASLLIAELWNRNVSNKVELDSRTAQYNHLAERHNAEIERALLRKPQASEQEKEVAGNLSKSVRKLTEKRVAALQQSESSEILTIDRIAATAGDGSVANLQQSNLLLQRRVEALQNSEQNLKQRLNEKTLLLDQERRRNATLKGA